MKFSILKNIKIYALILYSLFKIMSNNIEKDCVNYSNFLKIGFVAYGKYIVQKTKEMDAMLQ